MPLTHIGSAVFSAVDVRNKWYIKQRKKTATRKAEEEKTKLKRIKSK